MGCTVRELGSRLGSDELHEWIAYERIEPPPLAYLHAILEATAAVASAYSKRPLSAADFLPSLRRHSRPQSPAEGNAAMQAIRARMIAARQPTP